MRVRYELFNQEGYDSACAIREDLFPNDPAPTVKEFTKVGTGEIAGIIQAKFARSERFLIVDDETGEFIKVPISCCKRIKD